MKHQAEPPDSARSGENTGSFQRSISGRVLSERFLVLEDLTEKPIGDTFVVYVVKDLKEFCNKVVLKLASAPPDSLIELGPSFPQVCEGLIRLHHPAIEQILETGKLFDGRPYAVARIHEGKRLSSLIGSENRLELSQIASIVEQVGDALAAAHSKGILHCDLRPFNILVTDETAPGDVRIINFGSAWPIDSRGESLARLGMDCESLFYAAPELYSTLGHRSAASDIFSLSVLTYRLVTGKLPFAGIDRRELLEAMSASIFERPSEMRTDISLQTENLLLAGLQFEPAGRPRNIEDFGSRLADSLRPPLRGLVDVEPEPVEAAADEVVQAAALDLTPVPEIESRIPFTTARVRRQTTSPVSDRAVAWTLITLLLAGALSIPIAQILFREAETSAAAETMIQRPAGDSARHQLKFWLEPDTAGPANRTRQAADSRDRLLPLNLVVDAAGSAYLFKEFTDAAGSTSYQLIYPLAAAAAAVEPGKPLRATASAAEDTRAIWIVWTATKNGDIESIRNSVAENAVVPEEHARRLRHFLERNRNLHLTVTAGVDGQTILDGIGEKIIYRVDVGK